MITDEEVAQVCALIEKANASGGTASILEPALKPIARAIPRRDVNSEALAHRPDDFQTAYAKLTAALPFVGAEHYDEFRRIACGIKAELGERGLPIFGWWALNCAGGNYDESQNRRIWDGITPDGGITVASVYAAANSAGWDGNYQRPQLTPPAADSVDAAETPNEAQPADLSAHVHAWTHSKEPPQARQFVFGTESAGLIPLGCVTVLAGPGGSGKSALAVAAALSVALGADFVGLPAPQGAAIYLSAEDDGGEVARRLSATLLAQHPEGNPAVAASRMQVLDLAGRDARLTRLVYGNAEATALADRLIQQVELHGAECGIAVRLVIIDHARVVAGGDINDSAHVTELMRALSHAASKTGAAVMLLAHSPKSSINPAREADFSAADVLGSGAFHDNARCVFVLSTLVDSERKRAGLDAGAARRHVALRVIKSNYSESGRVFYLRRSPVQGWGAAVLDLVELAPRPARQAPTPSNQDARLLDYLRRFPGRFSPRTLRELGAGKDGPLHMSHSEVEAAVKRLMIEGVIVEREPTAAERELHSLAAQIKRVLHLRSETPPSE